MRTSALAAAACAGSAGLSSFATGASVDAGTLATVSVDAPLYDPNLAADNGCDPSGCVGDLTRDGDAASLDSRWSCKPALGPAGSTCSITYTLSEALTLDALNIALYKGDTRTRTIDVLVDGRQTVTWTSSGTTNAFETVELAVSGQTIELQGVLTDSEWLSIMEVEILVDDGGPPIVEAGELGIVTTASDVYDTRLAAANGCDPQGCTADLTRDGDLTEGSRWSCAPTLGGTCSISYDLGAVRDLSELRLALHKGATRVRTVEVYVDGTLATTWTSSGTTNGFESIDLSGSAGEVIEVTGVLADMEWLSIIETEIMMVSDSSGPGTPSPAATPTASPTTNGAEQEAGAVGTVTAASDLYDTNLSGDGGCDPAGCVADLTRDGDLSEGSRWSCAPKLGGACSISYDLGAVRDLSRLRLALYKGATRARTVEVYVDGALFTTWTSSGTIDGFESIDLSGMSGTVIEIVGVLGNSEWLSIIETEIMMLSSDGVTLPPTPTPTDHPATPAPVGTIPTGELQTVGPLPLASTAGTTHDPSKLRAAHALKDGDMSTSFSCADHGAYWDDETECFAVFNMAGYHHIKQVKIALANGAAASTDITIDAQSITPRHFPPKEYFTSSGSTEDFETYDFDYFTNYVTISWVFISAGQTFGIAEVEFIEEVQTGEVQTRRIQYPFDLSTGPATTAPEFISDSSEVLDKTLKFYLNYFTAVTSLLLQFPAGDTYKFDVSLYDHEGELLHTQLGLESTDTTGWQSFDIAGETVVATLVEITIKGTGSGAPGFKLLDARVIGDIVDNPTDLYLVGSTNLEEWGGPTYPDFVAEGTGDQKAIMGAICAVKKAAFNGVDCVGGDDTASGTVSMSEGEWFVDGNIFMKSGVTLLGRYYPDDFPSTTELFLEEGAAGKTDVPALIVMDGISDAKVEKVWVNGRYFPESSDGSPAVGGLGSVGISIAGSQDVGLIYTEVNNIDGDGVRVHTSSGVNIDGGQYNEDWSPWGITENRGTGLVVDSSDTVWIRRYDVSDNGVAGIQIVDSNNFTFEATFEDDGDCSGFDCREGLFKGRVGSADGYQPIEVIIESSTLVKFQDMKVISTNDPVMTVTGSETAFENCGFSDVPSGNCVIQTDALSTVTTSIDPELTLVGTCYVKV